jgi:hypothetical protein
MALAVPRIRLRVSVPVATVGPDPWPGGCGWGTGDTMNVFAANDLEAVDLLALARLDDDGDGAPPAGEADTIAAASGHARQQLTPAHNGVA